MNAISPIGGTTGYNPGVIMAPLQPIGGATGAQMPLAVQATSLAASSASVSAQMESLISTTSATSNSDMVNALLLLLAMKLLSGESQSEDDKKLLGGLLLLALAAQQPQQTSTLMYQSLSISLSQEQIAYSWVATQPLSMGAGQLAYGGPSAAAVAPASTQGVSVVA